VSSRARKLRFRRNRRVCTRRDIRRVFGSRCIAADDRFVVHVGANDGRPMRLAVVVGRQFGPAVRRNRFRRVVREAFRINQQAWPDGYDIVVRPQKGLVGGVGLQDAAQSLARLIPSAVARLTKRRNS
jgi:ribonuclease P protein component